MLAHEECRVDTAQATWPGFLGRSRSWLTAFWRHFPEQAQTASTLIEATLKFHRRHPSPFLKLSPAGTAIAAGFGLRHEWQGDPLGRMTVVHRPIQWLSDWQVILRQNISNQVLDYFVNSAAIAIDQCPEPVHHTVFDPFTVASQLAGPALLRDHIASEPILISEVVEHLSRSVCELIRMLRSVGLQGIYLATQTSTHSLFAPDRYAAWVKSSLERCIESARSMPLCILHLHGENVFLPLRELPANWTAHYEWSSSNPAFDSLGAQATESVFIGAPEALLRSEGGKREVLAALKKAIGGRSGLLTPGCCLPIDFPAPVLDEWRDAAARF